jgi:hypothetical protein
MSSHHLAVLLASAIGMLAPACDKAAPAHQESPPGASAGAQAAAAAPVAAQTTGPPSCALLSPAEVSALLGVGSLKAPEKEGQPPVTVCNFSEEKKLFPSVTLRFETGRDAATFALMRKSHDDNDQKTSDFPGLTPGAFSVTLSKSSGVSFLHKNTVVLVTAIAPLEKVAALAHVVMQRM